MMYKVAGVSTVHLFKIVFRMMDPGQKGKLK